MHRRETVEYAIRSIAAREGITENEVRIEIQRAMIAGMNSQKTKVQARWHKIPHKGSMPTPEELVEYLVSCMDAGVDPFA